MMDGDIEKDLASFEAAVRSGAGPEAEQVSKLTAVFTT
jgi:hypothetical protein